MLQMNTIVYIIMLTLSGMVCYEQNVNKMDLCALCECSVYQNIFLNCAKKQLNFSIDTWPQQFLNDDSLEEKTLTVKLNFNQIKTLEPFPNITCKDVIISLEYNKLEKISYAAFKNIPNIYYLNLGYNKLNGDAVRGDIFRGPYSNQQYEAIKLEVLHLEHNLIHSLERRMFQHTPYLKSLYLSNNPLGMLDDVTILALSSITHLEILDLSYTGIKYLPDSIMKHCKSIQELNLNGNKFKTVPESLGSVGPSLRKLTMSENLIEELNDNSFLGLWSLEYLEIGNMETLKKVKASTFAQLLSLKILHLCHNKNLQEIDHNAFMELKSRWPIKELYIHDNYLSTIPEDLVEWDKLVSVNLEDNPWNCDCKMAKIIEDHGIQKKITKSSSPRCITPLEMSGFLITELNSNDLCNKSSHQIAAPYFMKGLIHKPASIFFGFGFVVIVVIFGLSIGCFTSYVRNKLKRVKSNDAIRYTNLIA